MFTALAVIVALVVAIVVIIGTLRRRNRIQGVSHRLTLPYSKRRFLLTKAEKAFYLVLEPAVPQTHIVFPKVRMADVLQVHRNAINRQAHLNRITSKHFDFLICDRQWLEPRLAIELDDVSHGDPARSHRDRFVDSAGRAAALPVLHVPARPAYDQGALSRQIHDLLAAESAPAPSSG